MSSDAEAAERLSAEEAIRAVKAGVLPFDQQLESLVMYINLLDSAEIGVTLHVKGAVVSGLLISARSYFNLTVRALDEAAESNPGAKSFANFFRTTLDQFLEVREAYETTEKLPPRPHHLHLRQPQTFVTASQPLIHQLWRGRLTEIDGWSIGNLGEPIPPLPPDLLR